MNAIARYRFLKPATLIGAAVLCFAYLSGFSSVSALELTPLASAAATSSVTPPNPRDTLARQLADPDFDTALRDQLVSAARYPALPDPNRPAPRGKTTVTFEITPDGRVTDAAITESSKSRQLDRAALAIVQRAGRGLPAGTSTSGDTRRYLVTFDFRLGATP
jgi:TonB family protein